MKYNIHRLYWIKFSRWFMLYMPIIVPFYQLGGLSLTEVMLLQSVYSLTIAFSEIPTGFFADKFGKKSSIILGTLAWTIGFVFLSYGYGFWWFFPAQIMLGLGNSFVSGCDSALLFDTLKTLGKKEQFIKFEGYNVGIGNIAEAISAILGGILAVYSLNYPIYIQTALTLLTIPAALTLVEPDLETIKQKVFSVKSYFQNIREELNKVWFYIGFSVIIGAATWQMAWLAQPLFKVNDIDIKYFGWIWAGLNGVLALSSFSAHKVEKLLKTNKSLILIGLGIPILYLLIAKSSLVVVFLLFLVLFYIIRGFATPVLRNYIHQNISSENRSTIFSVRSLMIRIITSIIAPLFGILADKYGIEQAVFIGGIVFFSMIITLFLTKKMTS